MGLTLLGQWLLQDHNAQDAYLASYGEIVASQVARLGQDAMVREDVIALNVLAEQVSTEHAIASVTIYSMDGTIMAEYGEPGRGIEFSHPIQLADATAGFVKVNVVSNAMATDEQPLVGPAALRMLAGLLLSALLLWPIISWLTTKETRQPRDSNAGHAGPDSQGVLLPNRDQSRDQGEDVLLLIVHLFNSNDMQALRSQALMDAAIDQISGVAKLYKASFEQLTANTIAVRFNDPDSHDRSFQAACAALVVSRLCNQPGGGRYRYSLQRASASGSSEATSDVLDDALLHAALAEDNCIALSAEYAHSLPRSERLELTSEHSPVLGALQTSDAQDYFLLSAANAATEDMLRRQVEAIKAG